MRNKKTVIALIAVIVLALGGGTSSLAANPLQAESTATVVFEPFTQWHLMQVTRPGPEHDSRPPLGTPGPFMLAWVPTFDFGIHQLGSFTMGTTVTNFDVLPYAHGAPTNPDNINTHFVNVWDYRNFVDGPGSNGWNVTVRKLTFFREYNPATGNLVPSGAVLDGARIELRRTGTGNVSGFSLDRTTVMASATDSVNTPVGNLPQKNVAAARWIQVGGTPASPVPGSIVNVANSTATTGMGSTAINLGYGADVRLEIPNNQIQVGHFVADLRWTLTAGPNWLVDP